MALHILYKNEMKFTNISNISIAIERGLYHKYIYCWNNPRRRVNRARIRIERGLDHEYNIVCWFLGEAVLLVIDCKSESGDYITMMPKIKHNIFFFFILRRIYPKYDVIHLQERYQVTSHKIPVNGTEGLVNETGVYPISGAGPRMHRVLWHCRRWATSLSALQPARPSECEQKRLWSWFMNQNLIWKLMHFLY